MTHNDDLTEEQIQEAWELADRCIEAQKDGSLPRVVSDREILILMKAIRLFEGKFDNEVGNE
jgi:hypothetical protein